MGQHGRQQKYCQKRGWTLLASAVVSLIIFSYRGRRNSIEQQMLPSAIENNSASVSADGTQNIPPSAIPSRWLPFLVTSKLNRVSSMTRLILIAFLFYPTIFYGQLRFDTSTIATKYAKYGRLYYFLDSQRIDIDKTYFNHKNIQNFTVTKDTVTFYATTPICIINLSTKRKNIQLTSLAELYIKRSSADTSRIYKYIIDGKVIDDTSNVRIDPTFVKSISINNNKQMISGRPTTYFIITTKGNRQKNGSQQKYLQ